MVSTRTFQFGKATIRILKGDITEEDTDAVVNAANSSLMGGGGVDEAIHRKGGSRILEECKRIRATIYPEGLPIGKAVVTSGGNLKAKYVIHTVGPIWQDGLHGEPAFLEQAYRNSLIAAALKGVKSVAFPSISTGAYRYPIEEASRIALKTVKKYLEKEDTLSRVDFVLFSERDLGVYLKRAKELF